MNYPFVRVLGTSGWHSSKHNDGSCYTVNDQMLIDANSGLLMNLLNQNVDPLNITTILFTHMHADHYMGLAPFLMYWRVKKNSLEGLTIAGPKESVKAGFERAFDYAFHDSTNISQVLSVMPKIIPLAEGEGFSQSGLAINTLCADHAVPGLCYRITDEASQKSIGFSGDTRYRQEYKNFFNKVNILFYESGLATGSAPPPEKDFSRHSSVYDALRVGEEARVGQLMLTHMNEWDREKIIKTAKSLYPYPVDLATTYQRYVVK